MSTTAQALADQFDKLNEELIAAITVCSDAQWQATCAADGRQTGVLAYHLARIHGRIASMLHKAVSGSAFQPVTMDQIEQENAQDMVEHAHCTTDEVLALLQSNGAAAASIVRDLDEDQLRKPATLLAFTPPMTVEQAIEHVLIGHAQGHIASLRAALS